MKLITGSSGLQHVRSEDVAEFHKGIISQKNFVLNTGQKLSAQLQSNNIIRISAGDIIHAGRHSRVLNYEDVQIANGSQGVNRTDVVVSRYTKDAITGIENEELVVIKGTTSTPAAPQPGDMLLYTVTLTGVNITSIKANFSVLIGMKELEELLLSKETALKKTINDNYTTLNTLIKSNATNITKNNTSINSINNELREIHRDMDAGFKDLADQIRSLGKRVDSIGLFVGIKK